MITRAKNFILKIKEKLIGHFNDLKAKLKIQQEEPEFGDDIDSFEEEADETTEYSNRLGIQQTLKEEMGEVEHALNKIDEGKFGICEKCGKEIEPELLEIDPESRFCKACKKNQNKKK
ncbi:MAG: TraR/DksA C4-type zinc finger protein [Candidatus Pacebacteria bacterium]|nr:TraR/DksA C4-type zinc finger protein [Candidatus Paceibacterota bacterium]